MTALEGTLGFIGGGNMAEAMTGAVISARVFDPKDIRICDIDAEKLEHLAKKYGVEICDNPADLFSSSDVVILSVKPQVMGSVLEGLARSPGFPFQGRKQIMSIAAGVPLSRMEKLLYADLNEAQRTNMPLVRVMPNTPSLVLAGMSGYCLNAMADESDARTAETILCSMGQALRLEERFMDAVTAVSGSGPAYFFLMIESMVEGGVRLGLTRDQALTLSVQTMKGAAALLEQSQEDPEILRKKVTSPGGTTEAAIRVFTERGMKDTVIEALAAAARRAGELAG